MDLGDLRPAAERLEGRFRLLRGGGLDRIARHGQGQQLTRSHRLGSPDHDGALEHRVERGGRLAGGGCGTREHPPQEPPSPVRAHEASRLERGAPRRVRHLADQLTAEPAVDLGDRAAGGFDALDQLPPDLRPQPTAAGRREGLQLQLAAVGDGGGGDDPLGGPVDLQPDLEPGETRNTETTKVEAGLVVLGGVRRVPRATLAKMPLR